MPSYRNTFRHAPLALHRVGALVVLITAMVLAAACSSRPASVPAAFADTADSLRMSPDYRGVTIPPNIAPLNFRVTDDDATEYVATIGDIVCAATRDGLMDIDTAAWRQTLAAARGGDIAVSVYAHRPTGWVRYPAFDITVAADDIDPILTYRLIEPGYELYRQTGIYQRDLTTFDELPVYENNRTFSDDDNHCVNCHTFQANDSRRTLFHVRASHGGTIVTDGTQARKIAIAHDSILGAGVYPSWHPELPLVAFSTNKTGQVFHMLHAERIEVLDEASDLILYDAQANTVSNILRTERTLETFPCWAPDGRRLYYCAAQLPPYLAAGHTPMDLALRYDSLLYDIYSIPFDPDSRCFGAPRLEVAASAMGRSAGVPRLSPDGRWLLYTLGDYGQFHIWHHSADLWMKAVANTDDAPEAAAAGTDVIAADPATAAGPATASSDQPLAAANSSDADSYHSWSSNSRWIAFATRRDDGLYTRIYIAHIDAGGRAAKPFLLPQRDPEQNTLLLKSYNVPELARNPVGVSPSQLEHTVMHTKPESARYVPASGAK